MYLFLSVKKLDDIILLSYYYCPERLHHDMEIKLHDVSYGKTFKNMSHINIMKHPVFVGAFATLYVFGTYCIYNDLSIKNKLKSRSNSYKKSTNVCTDLFYFYCLFANFVFS